METKIMKVFIDKEMNMYIPGEVVFCDIDTPGPQFLGYVTLESFEKTNCIDKWVRVKIISGMKTENEKILGEQIVKGVKYHKES